MESPWERQPGVDRAEDLVSWSWSAVDRTLADDVIDPKACIPFVHPDTTTFYWELHFQARRLTRVDFLHRPALLRPAGEAVTPDPIVGRLVSWYEANEVVRRNCHRSVWLELDGPIDGRREAPPQGVSVCVDPRFGGGHSGDQPDPPLAALIEVFETFERACGGKTARSFSVADLLQAVRGAGGRTRHVSVMRGRPGQPAKIYAAVPKPALPSLLGALGWPGDLLEAVHLANVVCAESERVNIDLQIDDRLSERIGFELFSDPSSAADINRLSATEHAFELGLVSRRQIEGLRRWPGTSRLLLGADQWPTTIRRWFDLKFVALGAGRLELKAYLGFRMCEGIFR